MIDKKVAMKMKEFLSSRGWKVNNQKLTCEECGQVQMHSDSELEKIIFCFNCGKKFSPCSKTDYELFTAFKIALEIFDPSISKGNQDCAERNL